MDHFSARQYRLIRVVVVDDDDDDDAASSLGLGS